MPLPSDVAGKLAEAARLKEAGNAWVKQGEWRKACKEYRTVFAFVNGLVKRDDQAMAKFSSQADLLDDAQAKAVDELKRAAYANLSLCYLKQDKPEQAAECAEKALEIRPDDAKCLLRLGAARTALGDWERAKAHLVEANKLEPGNAAVVAELKKWQTAYGEWRAKQADLEKQAFGGKLL